MEPIIVTLFIQSVCFIPYLGVLKFVLKRHVPFRMAGYYITGWVVGFATFTCALTLLNWDLIQDPILYNVSVVIGFLVLCLSVDVIIWCTGKWLSMLTEKTPPVRPKEREHL